MTVKECIQTDLFEDQKDYVCYLINDDTGYKIKSVNHAHQLVGSLYDGYIVVGEDVCNSTKTIKYYVTV